MPRPQLGAGPLRLCVAVFVWPRLQAAGGTTTSRGARAEAETRLVLAAPLSAAKTLSPEVPQEMALAPRWPLLFTCLPLGMDGP